ncbi:hypothetical protein BDV10DRAFT_36647 [Aspergillus recurvatus]
MLYDPLQASSSYSQVWAVGPKTNHVMFVGEADFENDCIEISSHLGKHSTSQANEPRWQPWIAL